MSFDEKRLEEIRTYDHAWPNQTTRDLLSMVDDLRAQVDVWKSNSNNWEDACRRVQVERDTLRAELKEANDYIDDCLQNASGHQRYLDIEAQLNDARTLAEYRKTHREAALERVRKLKKTLQEIYEIRQLVDRENFGCISDCTCTGCTLCLARAALAELDP